MARANQLQLLTPEVGQQLQAWELSQPRCLGQTVLPGMGEFSTSPSWGRACAAQPTGSTKWVPPASLSHICCPFLLAAVPASLPVAMLTPSSSSSLGSFRSSFHLNPRTPLLECPGTIKVTGGATRAPVSLKAIGLGGNKANTAGGTWSGLVGKKTTFLHSWEIFRFNHPSLLFQLQFTRGGSHI